MQLAVATRQLRYPAARDHRGLVRDLSEKVDLALAAVFCDRYRMPQLRRIKPTKPSLYFPMFRPPCRKLGSVRPSNPQFSSA
jgi:hypothetical protein